MSESNAGRNVKLNADFFFHNAFAYEEPIFKKLFMRMKTKGYSKCEIYGCVWVCMEMICREKTRMIHVSPEEYEVMSYDMEIKPELIEEVIITGSQVGLFKLHNSEFHKPNQFDVSSPYLDELLKPLMSKRDYWRDRAKVRREKVPAAPASGGKKKRDKPEGEAVQPQLPLEEKEHPLQKYIKRNALKYPK